MAKEGRQVRSWDRDQGEAKEASLFVVVVVLVKGYHLLHLVLYCCPDSAKIKRHQ